MASVAVSVARRAVWRGAQAVAAGRAVGAAPRWRATAPRRLAVAPTSARSLHLGLPLRDEGEGDGGGDGHREAAAEQYDRVLEEAAAASNPHLVFRDERPELRPEAQLAERTLRQLNAIAAQGPTSSAPKDASNELLELYGLIEEADQGIKKVAALRIYTFIHGKQQPIPKDWEQHVSEKDFEREMKYLLPSQLIRTKPNTELRRPEYDPEREDEQFHFEIENVGNTRAAVDQDATGIAAPGLPIGSLAHFTARHQFYDFMAYLDRLEGRMAERLALARAAGEKPQTFPFQSVGWLKQPDLEVIVGARLKIIEYETILARLGRLWRHPLRDVARQDIEALMRSASTLGAAKTKIEMDERHGVISTGRRKSAIARVRVKQVAPGKQDAGRVSINGQSLAQYFSSLSHRLDVLRPLKLTGTMAQCDVSCFVQGGGPSGQAGAIRLALSRSLSHLDPAWRKPLKSAKMLTRDWRRVERKKAGQPGARRKRQWVKR